MDTTNRNEIVGWVSSEIARLRTLSYEELLQLEGAPVHRSLQTRAGQSLVLETQVLWDDRRGGNLRVIVDVWDQSRRVSFGSLAKDDFIRAPDGSFVGE